MSDLSLDAPVKRRKTKAAEESGPAETSGPRKWENVVPKIRALKDQGRTVPEIAEELQLSYVLVNQVILQSYKMSVDTIGVFERQERMRLGLD